MRLEKIDGFQNEMNLYRLDSSALPLTFAIRTLMGRVAAVQITSITNNPPSLKLRYKLQTPRSNLEEP